MMDTKNHKRKSVQQKQKAHIKRLKRREKLIKNNSTKSAIAQQRRMVAAKEAINNPLPPVFMA